MYEITRNVLAEVKKAIVGKDDVISKVWIALLAEGHVLLEDVPGVGKTTMALAFSRALGLDTKRIQFTPDTMPSDIIGFSMPGKDGMVYQPGAIMTNLLLADEINRTSSKTQSALLEAMEEGQVTVDRVTHPLPRPFAVLATQNPVGSAGTQDLPNSQLDRFLMKLSMGYPDLQSQIHILRDRSGEDPLTRVQAVADRDALCEAIRRHLFQRVSGEVGQVKRGQLLELVFLHVHANRERKLLAVHRLPQQGKLCIGHGLAGGVGVVVDAHIQPGGPGVAVVGLKGGVDVQAICPLGELAVSAHGLEHCPLVARRCHLRPVDKALIPAHIHKAIGRVALPAGHSLCPGGFGRFRCGLCLFGILLVPGAKDSPHQLFQQLQQFIHCSSPPP